MEALFDSALAKRNIELADKLRQKGLIPFAIGLMATYAKSGVREKVIETGTPDDLVTVAGAARITHVSSNMLGKIISPHPKEIVYRGIVKPISNWFDRNEVMDRLRQNPRTIHSSTDWELETLQDQMASTAVFPDNISTSRVIVNALNRIASHGILTPELITEENAASASAIGVLHGRLAKILAKTDRSKALGRIQLGIDYVETAQVYHGVNSDRIKALYAWKAEIENPNQQRKKSTSEKLMRSAFDIFPLAQILALMYR